MKRYLVFDIGCIECGEESGVVGLYATLEEAIKARDDAAAGQERHWTGQHSFEVFDLDVHLGGQA